MEDLSNLLNTRVSPFWKDYAKNPALPFSYGITITAPTSAENAFELSDIEKRIDEVIARFEPRLREAKSQIIGVGKDPSTLFVNIDAILEVENRRIPLSFPLIIA
jgi:predicted component of type VI protein secretion system